MDNLSLYGTEIRKLVNRGAEAAIYEGSFLDEEIIIKHRFPKYYRADQIDLKLRKERTIQEVRLLQFAKEIGINVPYVLDVDKLHWVIIMEKVAGQPLKLVVENDDLHPVFIKLGKVVAGMHSNGIVHGDLTTSNIYLDNEQNIWLIDFGLGFISQDIEDYAVDNLVLKHILESSHPEVGEQCWNSFLEGYESVFKKFKEIKSRMETVELRVRYRTH